LIFVSLILLLAVVGFCVWKAKNPEPVVYTRLLVARQTPRVLDGQARRGLDSQDYNTFSKALPELVKSRTVLNSALRAKSVSGLALIRAQNEPIVWLQKQLQVTFDPDAGMLRIALLHGDVSQRAPIVEAVRKEFLNEIVFKDKVQEQYRLNKLTELVSQYQETLRTKEGTLRQLQRSVGIVPPGQELATKMLGALEKELFEVESQKRKVQAKLVIARSQEKEAAPKGDQLRYQQELEYLNELEKAIRKAYEAQHKQVHASRDTAVDNKWLEKEIEEHKEITGKLTKQKNALELEMFAPPRIREFEEVVAEAQPPWPQSLFTDLREWLGW
jgi:hypothetical protein